MILHFLLNLVNRRSKNQFLYTKDVGCKYLMPVHTSVEHFLYDGTKICGKITDIVYVCNKETVIMTVNTTMYFDSNLQEILTVLETDGWEKL